MWIRSLRGFSPHRDAPRRAAVAGLWRGPALAMLLFLQGSPVAAQTVVGPTGKEPTPPPTIEENVTDPAPVQRQESAFDGITGNESRDISESDVAARNLDLVSEEILRNAFTQLRFKAIMLEGEDETGQALYGIVRAYLARGEMDQALAEISRIDDNIWAARGLVAVADHLYDMGRTEDSLARLREAMGKFATGKVSETGGDVLQLIANRQAEEGDPDGAIASILRIPDDVTRIATLRQTARNFINRTTGVDRAGQNIERMLQEAYEQTAALVDDPRKRAKILTDIALAQIRIGRKDLAGNILREVEQAIETLPDSVRFSYRADLSAIMIEHGYIDDAMELVRKIPAGLDRARAYASAARIWGMDGDFDSSLPLFIAAKEQAESTEDEPDRIAALTHLIVEQTRAGRLRDAFANAGLIEGRMPQAQALLAMGKALIADDKIEEALKLIDYIPYIGMRAQILGPSALHFGRNGDRARATELLSLALDDTGFESDPAFIGQAVRDVMTSQILFGDPAQDEEIFARAMRQIRQMPPTNRRVIALVQLAIARAERGQIDAAQKLISAAYRDAWRNRSAPGFDTTLEDISLAQLIAGDLLSAFDTAARIKAPPGAIPERAPDGSLTAPRFRALTRVAAAAARLGEIDLAIRAANQMQLPQARAAGLAAVAVAMASPESSLLEIIGRFEKRGPDAPTYLGVPAGGDPANPFLALNTGGDSIRPLP